MAVLKNTRIQHLVLKIEGQKPTVPVSQEILPGDASWRDTDLLVGEWAFNQPDKIWYFNNGSDIEPFTGNVESEELTTDNVALYDADKPNDESGYAYYAGNTYVTYSNPDSEDEDYQEESIYRCAVNAYQGESPESSPEKWIKQGDGSLETGSGLLSNIFVRGTDAIKSITGYSNGNSIIELITGMVYKYESTATTGLQPNDNQLSQGRWVGWYRLNKNNLSGILTPQNDGMSIYMPVGNVVIAIFGPGTFNVTDESGEVEHTESFESAAFIVRTETGYEQYPLAQGSGSGLGSTWETDASAIRALTTHDAGMDVGDYSTGAIYEYDDSLTNDDDGDTYLKPDDVTGAGRWVKKKVFSVSGHVHTLSNVTPATGNAKKVLVVNEAGTALGYTTFDFDQIVQIGEIDMSDVDVGESKILLAKKQSDGTGAFEGAVSEVDKIGPPSLSSLLDSGVSGWVGDEITLSGDNTYGALGQNSQEFYDDDDWFLCISHTDTSATWRRNRGQDCLNEGEALADSIIAELETESGWNTTSNFKQTTSKSKKGSWYRRNTGGYLYMCIDTSNGWCRIGTPSTVDLEITSSSYPALTTNLGLHDFVTFGFYDESQDVSMEDDITAIRALTVHVDKSYIGNTTTGYIYQYDAVSTETDDGDSYLQPDNVTGAGRWVKRDANETAEQGQEYWDEINSVWYKRNRNGKWAKMN